MKKNVIISSVLVIALCLSVIAGSTFALFTSESTVNASVSAGNVSVSAKVEESTIELGSTLGTNVSETSVTYTSDSNVITLSKLIPGDYVNFNIIVKNFSDVTVNYRTILKKVSDDGLWSGLVVTFDGVEFDGNDRRAAWANLTPNSEDIVIPVKVSLPEDRGNEYQGKTCSFAYTVETLQGNAPLVDVWDGSESVAWYNESASEFSLEQASQVAGFLKLVDEGTTFEGKTITLKSNLDLEYYSEADSAASESEPVRECFAPIGSYRFDKPFKGTFDGNGKAIENLYQNTWALDNGYYYSDCGLGFFGAVEDAHIKDVSFKGVDISGESALCGVVAGVSAGECTFENVTVEDARCADYQYYSGGIVGWASGKQSFINCVIDDSVSIAAQWGDFDNSTGGLIGGCSGSSEIFVKNCVIACRIDAYNDVTSSYQWYAYRRCGMIIGNTGKTANVDGKTVAAAPQLTCENVTVIYGEWADYTYCEFAGTSWPYVRVQAGVSNSAYSNPRYGHPTDANGNQVVDENHVHNDGEDHNILCVFDQLYGGGQGVYGNATHEGVTVIYNNPSKASA